MSELQPSNTDAILGGQNPTPANAAVLGGALGVKGKLAHELGLSDKLTAEFTRTHDIFSFETVTISDRDKIAIRSKKQAFYYPEKLANDITIDMVYIPAGSFMMGSDLESDEQPIHQGHQPKTKF